MELENVNEIGKIVLQEKVFRDIAQIATLKVDGIYPVKKNDFADIKMKDEKLSVILHIKLGQDIDIVKACTKAQMKVREALEDMTGLPVGSINVDIQGFVKEKEDKESRK